MVRPSQERSTRALTDTESISIGDGTDTTDDGIDFDNGGGSGSGGGGSGGAVTPPVSDVLFVTDDSGTLVEIDLSVANWWDITLTADCTLTITGTPSGVVELHVILRQGTGAPWLVTWPAEVDWPDTDGTGGGSAPTLWTVETAQNVIVLTSEDSGVSWGGTYDSTGGGGGGGTFGTPAIVLGTAAAAGSIDEVIRRDSTIVAFDATVPVTQASGDSAATGSAAVAARRDHKHGMPTLYSDPMTTRGDMIYRGGAGTTRRAVGTVGQRLVSDGTDPAWTDSVVAIVAVFDGGGSTLTTGVKLDLSIPFACTVTGVRMLADVSGSIVVDIWKDTYANYPPTVADTITASAKPTITTATKSEDTTLTGWTLTIAAGDTLRFNIDSVTSIARLVLTLKAKRTA